MQSICVIDKHLFQPPERCTHLWKTHVKEEVHLRTFPSSWQRGNTGSLASVSARLGRAAPAAGACWAPLPSGLLPGKGRGRTSHGPSLPTPRWVLAGPLRSLLLPPQAAEPDLGQVTIYRPRWDINFVSASILPPVRKETGCRHVEGQHDDTEVSEGLKSPRGGMRRCLSFTLRLKSSCKDMEKGSSFPL